MPIFFLLLLFLAGSPLVDMPSTLSTPTLLSTLPLLLLLLLLLPPPADDNDLLRLLFLFAFIWINDDSQAS
jgi:hypothetical protein